ncbi:24182_t:CDS:2, partial [Racocetra persica]
MDDTDSEDDDELNTLEVTRILSNSQDNNNQLHEDKILDENKILDNEILDNDEDIIQQLQSFKKFPEIQYIVQHPPVPVSFCSFQQFVTNDTLNFKTLLQICQNHDAFSYDLKSNFNNLYQTTIDTDNTKISEKVVNKLITEITTDNIDNNQKKK